MLEGSGARRRPQGRAGKAIRGGCAVVLAACWVTTDLALAAGSGLPQRYDVARYDSPSPGATAQYPLGLSNAGDLNGDGNAEMIGTFMLRQGNTARHLLFLIAEPQGGNYRTALRAMIWSGRAT